MGGSQCTGGAQGGNVGGGDPRDGTGAGGSLGSAFRRFACCHSVDEHYAELHAGAAARSRLRRAHLSLRCERAE